MAPTPKAFPVLVVDDARATRNRLCALLTELDGVVATGCSADRSEVTPHLEHMVPGAIVIDVPARPEGFALLAELRQRCANAVIAVLSSYQSADFRRRSLAAGADHYLDKSTEFERLTELVSALVLAR